MARSRYSFRLDKYLIDKAKNAGVDLPKFIEAALAKTLKDKRCPYCGAQRKKET